LRGKRHYTRLSKHAYGPDVACERVKELHARRECGGVGGVEDTAVGGGDVSRVERAPAERGVVAG
jgi:hypothetical protein